MRAIIVLVVLGLTATSVMSACVAGNALTQLITSATVANSGFLATLATTDLIGANAAVDSTVTSNKCYPTLATKMCVTVASESKLIADIQSYVSAQKTAMQTAAGVRDAYIIAQRGEVIDVLSSLRRLNEIADSDDDVTIPTAYATYAATFISYADAIAANFTAIVEGFDTYQENRAKCMNALLATQAAILCNIFREPTITGIDHTTPAVTLGDAFLSGDLNTACFAYIQNSATQSSIILTSAYSKGLTNLVNGLNSLLDGDATAAATSLSNAFTSFATVTFSSTNAQKPVEFPKTTTTACTTTACTAWYESLFSTLGVLDQDKTVRGGDVPSIVSVSSRVLSEGNERRLAATGLAPTLSQYTFTYGFETNPGNVDNTENANSALRNGIVAVAVAALALVF